MRHEYKKPWFKLIEEKSEDSDLLKCLVMRKDKLFLDMNDEHETTEDFVRLWQVGTESGGSTSSNINGFHFSRGNISYNVIRPMIEEALAKTSQVNTLPVFFGKDTNFMERRCARELNKYIDRMFSHGDIYSHGAQAELKSLVGNLGILKFMINEKEDRFDFYSPDFQNIAFIDPYEGEYMKRDEICELNEYQDYELIDMFPHMKEEIKRVYGKKDQKIKVWQIWMSYKACATFTENLILERKKISVCHPYTFKVRTRPYKGCIGRGLTHTLLPYQVEIDKLLRRITTCIDYHSFPLIFAPIGAKISKMLNNQPGNVYKYNGTQPPIVKDAPKVSSEVIRMLFSTIEQAFKEARQNMDSVGGDPFGSVRSATGLTKKLDIERSGHYNTLKDYEMMFIKTAQKMIKWGMKYNVCKDKYFFVQFPEIEDHLYKLKKYPMDFTSNSPQQKLAMSEAIISSGYYSPEELINYMDFPDQSVLYTSKIKRIHAIYKLIEDALHNNEFIEPDPVLGYDQQKEVGLKIYSTLIEEGLDYNDDKLVILDEFFKSIKVETDRINQQIISEALQNNPPATNEAPTSSPVGSPQLATGEKPASDLQKGASPSEELSPEAEPSL